MDRAPRAPAGDNFLKTRAALQTRTNKIIPDLVIRAPNLSGSNAADCDLGGAGNIMDFMALQDNTSTIPRATLEKG
jgi:hypothetical protein